MARIVLTGAGGYIGGILARRLAASGDALRLVTRSRAAADAVGEVVVADLRDEKAWSRVLDGADAIVHLSSRTDMRSAEADPAGDEELNVQPVRALIAAARAHGPIPVAFASTVTIYGANPSLPVDEAAPDNPLTVYEKHKLVCEGLLRDATRHGVLRAASLRLSNVYGHGIASTNSNRGILNAMMKRAMGGQALTLYGEGTYVRDFIHVEDVAAAFQAAVQPGVAWDGGSYIIATGEGCSLAEAYSMIAAEAERHNGRAVEVRRIPEPADLHPIERRNFVGNSALFRRLTGWRPRIGLAAGVRDFFERECQRE